MTTIPSTRLPSSDSTWRASRSGSSAPLHMKTEMRLSERCSSSPSMIGMREAAETVAGDQPDGEGLAAMQALGEVVRPEAELLGDGDHLGARLRLAGCRCCSAPSTPCRC